jgi:hypothetical protein
MILTVKLMHELERTGRYGLVSLYRRWQEHYLISSGSRESRIVGSNIGFRATGKGFHHGRRNSIIVVAESSEGGGVLAVPHLRPRPFMGEQDALPVCPAASE